LRRIDQEGASRPKRILCAAGFGWRGVGEKTGSCTSWRRKKQRRLNVWRLTFVDEFGIHRAMPRIYVRAKRWACVRESIRWVMLNLMRILYVPMNKREPQSIALMKSDHTQDGVFGRYSSEHLLLFLKFQVCISSLILLVSCTVPTQKFDSEKWKTDGKSVRGGMMDDLGARGLLEGKTESEIEKLLGPPDFKEDKHWVYKIATAPRCHYIWSCYLTISFDPQTHKSAEIIKVD
jgi:hypothetical protein